MLVLTILILVPGVVAQEPEPKKSESEGERLFELLGGYSHLRDDGHNLNGWTSTLIVNVNQWVRYCRRLRRSLRFAS